MTPIRTLALTAALLGIVASAAPVFAQTIPPLPTFPNRPPDATFYETPENMRVIGKGRPRRVAQSALIGFANPGNAFCPAAEVTAAVGSAKPCTLNALGEDDISLVTGLGTFDAKLTIVVQEPGGAVDSPEAVIGRRRASGRMDFVPAIFHQIPYGTITGRVRTPGADEENPPRFVGVFRLPFGCSATTACYLGLANGTLDLLNPVAVNANEYAIGFPAVRFDLWLVQ